MLKCKEVTKLISESMDTKLPLRKEIGLRIHLMMCKFCSLYKKQLLQIKKISEDFIAKLNDDEIFSSISLSSEAKERIKKEIANQ